MHRQFLFAVLIIYVVTAALYATNTPKWQAPDEPAHFNYIRAIGETGTLPILASGDYNQDYLEQIKAAKFPPSMSIDAILYESYQPPLYYLTAMPIYLIGRGFGIDATVLALRLFSVMLGVIVLLIAFSILREIFPNDELLPLATVGLMATVPQHIAVSASISNDLAAELVLVLILGLAIKRINNSITDYQFTILGGVLFGAALLTKTTAYVPGAVLLIVGEFARAQGSGGAGGQRGKLQIAFYGLRFILYAFLLALVISAPMFIRNMLTYGFTDVLGTGRHDAIVIGQPTTAEMIARNGLPRILADFIVVTFKSFWAQFGWMGVLVHERIYLALFLGCAIAVIGFALYALRIIRNGELLTLTQHWSIGLLIALFVVAGADYIGYNFKFLQFQGRYLFPALIAISFFLVVGWRELIPLKFQRIVFALLYAGLVVLDLACLFWFIVPQLHI